VEVNRVHGIEIALKRKLGYRKKEWDKYRAGKSTRKVPLTSTCSEEGAP
jgi:hypothetical protein